MSITVGHRHFWPISMAASSIILMLGMLPANAHESGHADDPSTKNSVSRAPASAGTDDPTTHVEGAVNSLTVELQRNEPLPTIVPGAARPARTTLPADRYAMAGGCYAMRSEATGKWVVTSGAGYAATAGTLQTAEPIHFQATDLGTYLLYTKGRKFVAHTILNTITHASEASVESDWTATRFGTGSGATFRFTLPTKQTALAVNAGGVLVPGVASNFTLHLASGCDAFPEVETNVTGEPFVGTSPFQEVQGYLDAHTHGMAFEFLGGKVHCGRPWHPYGVEAALQDCPDHKLANGSGAVVENFLKSGTPVGTHDPIGWPTFKDWPAPNSLTHEGTYYKWLERSWRGGQRILVNLLVENDQLCKIYPLKKNSCDDMDSIRLQAKDMRDMERYIDAQNGGPGKGWYRIVTDPYQARAVINQGKLAVVMGVETSVLFGCGMTLDKPKCTSAQIDTQLDELHALGVRQMELVNKFDNALAGVAGDEGGAAPLINAANFLETGSFWDMRKCPAGNADGVEDRNQLSAPSVAPEQDALFGAIAGLYAPLALPVYPAGPQCNQRGLTSLGDHTIQEMVKRKMLFDPDHMSVSARKVSLDVAEKLNYPGVLSSHSWSTPDAYPRIYKLGGVITPYAGDSAGFVDKWKKHLTWADGRFYFGFGYGADINGLGAQGNPRGADAPSKVTYPFTGLGGVTIDKQVSGTRVYDINTDGVSHYGLYPDWIEDLRKQAGPSIVADMARGSEAYLQMWERAEGVSNDACRDIRALKNASVIRGIAKGSSVKAVLQQAGQPHERLGTTFTYCATGSAGTTDKITVQFTAGGLVTKIV